MPPLVTAIVLNYRTPLLTAQCVRELLKQNIDEILVVDNHSTDDSIGTLRNRLGALPGVRILESPENAGFGRGYAIGIRQAKGEFLLINNPAKRLQPGALATLVRTMQTDPSIGIIGPKLVHEDGSVRFSARTFPRPLDVVIKRTFLQKFFPASLRRYLQLDRSPDEERATDWLAGGCFLIRTDLLRAVGGFDPRYRFFFEDIDLCRACWEHGKRVVYCPRAVALDRKKRLSDMSALLMPLRRMGRIHIASAVKYFWKWRARQVPRASL